jgi:acetate kinase
LTVNTGASTVKLALAVIGDGRVDVVERVTREIAPGAPRIAGLSEAFSAVGARGARLDAVGHRVVHGGPWFRAPVRVDARVEKRLAALAPLAPLHTPPALEGLRAAREAFPDRPQVAVFDTAFHAGRPASSMYYALPSELAEAEGLRRYGFHGIAHAALVRSLAEAEGTPDEEIRAVTLQLGAGCSACAVERGRSIETSMGFTPLEGLVMATRPGDVDAGVILHLLRSGRGPAEIEDLLNHRSGLLGLAGSADMRRVLAAETAGDERAALAVSLFVRRIVATVGAYLTLLSGRGAVVFGGGVGARSGEIRRRVAEGLRAWDVALDPARNASGAPGRISADGNRPVYTFETDEEREIARATARLLEDES